MSEQDSSNGYTEETLQKICNFRRQIKGLQCQIESGMNTLRNFMSCLARTMRTPGVALTDLPLAEVEKNDRLICKPNGEYELKGARVRLLTRTNGFCLYSGPAMKVTTHADGYCVYEAGDKSVIYTPEGSWQYSSQTVKIVCKPLGSYFYISGGLNIHFRSDGFFRCRLNEKEVLKLTYNEPDVADASSPEESADPSAATIPVSPPSTTSPTGDLKFSLWIPEVRGYEADEISLAIQDHTLFVQAARKTSDKIDIDKNFELGTTDPHSLRAILTAEGILQVQENPDSPLQDPFTVELAIEHL